MLKTATLSECGQYRFVLTREWACGLPKACIIMLNPSTADAARDDATIRALIRLLKALGYGGFEVVNLFAYRATDPRELKFADARLDVVGPLNNRYIIDAVDRCDVTICAWGAAPFVVQSSRGVEVRALMLGRSLWCFGTTKARAPKHPLYLKTGTGLQVYHG